MHWIPKGVKIDALAFQRFFDTAYGPEIAFWRHTHRVALEDVVYLQDNAPSHATCSTHRHFAKKYPGFLMEHFPAKSPDLNPLDFFVWSEIVREMRQLPVPADDIALKTNILVAAEKVRSRPGLAEKIMGEFRCRVQRCLAAKGGHFEHLYKPAEAMKSDGPDLPPLPPPALPASSSTDAAPHALQGMHA